MTTATSSALLTPEEVSDPYFKVRRALGNMAAQVFERIGFMPYDRQLEILAHPARFKLVTGGIQGGKTQLASPTFCRMYYADLSLNPPFGREEREYWVCGHRLEDTAYEWSALRRDLIALGLINEDGSSERADPTPIFTLNDPYNTTIKAKFTADPSKLSGVSPLGIIGCEMGHVTLAGFEHMLGRTVGKNAWMYLSGTLEQNAHPWYTAKILEWAPWDKEADAKSFSLPSWANEGFFPEGPDDPKIQAMKKAMKNDRFAQERIEGIPAPPLGLVYPEFDLDLHVMTEYKFEEDLPVYIWHDPGMRHYAAVLFAQHHGGVIYIFDEIYKKGLSTDQIAEIAMSKPWWKGSQKILGADPWYANRKTAQSAYSIDDIWLDKTGLTNTWTERYSIEERIDRVKATLRPNPETRGPQILVHHRNCHGLLSEFGVIGRPPTGELRPYAWKVDDDGDTIGTTPQDKNNDALDALGNGLLHLLGTAKSAYAIDRFAQDHVSTIESRDDFGYQTTLGYWGGHVYTHDESVSTPEDRGEMTVW